MPNEENKPLRPGWDTLGLECPALSTERLLLTPPTAEDAPALTRIQNTDFVLRYNAMERWDEERMRGWIERNALQQIVLRRREDPSPIGLVGLAEDSLRYGVDSVELNCYLSEDYARQGYMREALSCVLRHLFEAGAERVAARAFAPNIAPRLLLESLGFRQEGMLRRAVRGYGGLVFDDTLYSLDKAAWSAGDGRQSAEGD